MKRRIRISCLAVLATIGLAVDASRTQAEEVAFYYNRIAFRYASSAASGGVTFGGSGYAALPTDFFGPGSLPFEGSIPLDRDPELAALIIERNAQSPPPPPPPPPPPSGEMGGTEDINIGVGELQECSAIDSIVVNFSDGSTELWDVRVDINRQDPSGGWLRVVHNDPGEGGTIEPFDSFFDVFVDIAFSHTPASGPIRHRFFSIVDRTQLMPANNHPDFLWAPIHHSIGGGADRAFIPGADPANPNAPLQVLLFQGRGIDLPLVAVDVVPEPSVLIPVALLAACRMRLPRRRN
jgi:hypothetical protein